jgi:hypothetical protein
MAVTVAENSPALNGTGSVAGAEVGAGEATSVFYLWP